MIKILILFVMVTDINVWKYPPLINFETRSCQMTHYARVTFAHVSNPIFLNELYVYICHS